jgi:hypothetical protein
VDFTLAANVSAKLFAGTFSVGKTMWGLGISKRNAPRRKGVALVRHFPGCEESLLRESNLCFEMPGL